MKLSDLKLDSLEWQQGKGDRFRLVQVEQIPLNDWHSNWQYSFKYEDHSNWRYSFKYEDGQWFQIVLDNVNKLIEIIK